MLPLREEGKHLWEGQILQNNFVVQTNKRKKKNTNHTTPNKQNQIKLLTVRGDTAQRVVNGKAQGYPKLHQSPQAAQDGWAADPVLPNADGS